ncbi:galactosylceramide sulfotransferase-like [Branchiostoma floridae]|uniref:Galactosylceramide sulfotransferase-like n=1 Tax=Branchiostoma floridae TaxID=7739 RepID=A0A9J7LM72_BRAFL|nr:galactosylceramide sulfotransferase-like [Branchiostoma floridae]
MMLVRQPVVCVFAMIAAMLVLSLLWALPHINDERLYDIPPYLRVSSSIKSKSSVCQPNTNIAFIKTHKTGSSTVMQIFQRFGFLRNLSFLLPKGSINQLYPFGIRDRMYLPAPIEGRPFDILTHHTVYDRAGITQLLSANVTFVTIVREPMERLKSAFNFYKLAWRYKIPGPDPLLRFLENPGKFEHHITRNRDYETKNNIALELGFPPEESIIRPVDSNRLTEEMERQRDRKGGEEIVETKYSHIRGPRSMLEEQAGGEPGPPPTGTWPRQRKLYDSAGNN